MTKLETILDQIDSGTVLLPEFQRGYVWNRDQVRGLMDSLYRGFPVGSLLVWETETDPGAIRGSTLATAGVRLLLLDGQQRITTLYGVMRGRPPAFFDGRRETLEGLHFNVEEESFEFYMPAKMRSNPRWVPVSSVFEADGITKHMTAFVTHPETQVDAMRFTERLMRLHALRDREFHEEKITGSDKTVDTVVEIFNKVNSGGTKLSKGDLALAKICASDPSARTEMRTLIDKWASHGYHFSLDWLLRNVNAVVTGRAVFSALADVPSESIAAGLTSAAKHIETFLQSAQGRLGLDHDRVLMGRYGIPVISRLLELQGGRFADYRDRDRVLFWYVSAAIWGRHTGSVESVLTSDYEAVEKGGIDGLIQSLERWRGGNLRLAPHDFAGYGMGSRFYPLLYLMTRVLDAKDLGTGIPLKADMLGRLSGLQVHHIFPKAFLYDEGYEQSVVNSVANFAFLTQDTNLVIGRRTPAEYLAEVAERHPGALESQWIPTNPALWEPDRYLDFLEARQQLLAQAANSLLDALRGGVVPETTLSNVGVVIDAEPDPRSDSIRNAVEEVVALGCADPLLDTEVADPDSGRALAIAEAYWPDGLQPGLGAPVVLELEPDEADLPRLESLGYSVFTTPAALVEFVRSHRGDGLAEGATGDAVLSDAPGEAAPSNLAS